MPLRTLIASILVFTGLLLLSACISNTGTDVVIPTLAVLPTDSSYADVVVTPPAPPSPTELSPIQEGVDQLFTQTAQALRELEPTQTVIAAFNQALTATSRAASVLTATAQIVINTTATANALTTNAALQTQIAATEIGIRQIEATLNFNGTATADVALQATAQSQSQLDVINPLNLSQLEQIAVFDSENSFAFSPDGEVFATYQDNNVYLWNTSSLRQIASIRIDSNYSRFLLSGPTLAFSPRSQQFGITAYSSAFIYDYQREPQLLFQLDDAESEITTLNFDPYNERIITGNLNGEILVWSLVDGSLIKTIKVTNDITSLKSVWFLTAGNIIVQNRETIEVWSLTTGEKIDTVLTNSVFLGMALSLHGTELGYLDIQYNFASSEKMGIYLHLMNISRSSMTSNSIRVRALEDLEVVNSIALSPDGSLAAVFLPDLGIRRGNDPGVRFWDTKTAGELLSVSIQTTLASFSSANITFSPGGRLFAVVDSRHVYLFGVRATA